MGVKAVHMDGTWDLKDLYIGLSDPTIASDKERLVALVNTFANAYKGHIDSLSADDLLTCFHQFTEIDALAGLLSSYAYLFWSTQVVDAEASAFLQNTQEFLTATTTSLIFFTHELSHASHERTTQWLADSTLTSYHHFIRSQLLSKPYLLSPTVEAALAEQSPLTQSWVRLFDDTLGDMRFFIPSSKESLPISDVLHRLSSSNAIVRLEASQALSEGLKEKEKLFVLIYNTLMKEREIDNRLRGYPHVYTFRNLQNTLDDQTMQMLVDTVRSNYSALSHRYYALKAKLMGIPRLAYQDRNAPLPGAPERSWTFAEASDLVLDAYGSFSSKLRAVAEPFFHHPWIDVYPKAGKQSGAFAHGTVPSKHPYLLLNFYGKTRDVMTLAHELGHGVHQCLAGKQGALLSNTPLTIAETASVFGEMLTFQHLLRHVSSSERIFLLSGKIEDMLNTVVRQVAFHSFEERVHILRQSGQLSADDFAHAWLDTQRESLGSSVAVEEHHGIWWAYVPHFIHTPFYVYAYAFGDCLVNSLYASYTTNATPDFSDAYISLLEAGGSLSLVSLLKPFGLDPHTKAFWQGGLNVIISLIDALDAEISASAPL